MPEEKGEKMSYETLENAELDFMRDAKGEKMSVEEIDSVILTDIKPSVFYEALVNIRDTAHFFAYSSLMDKKQEKPKIDSLCSAFTELYALAQGEYVSKKDVCDVIKQINELYPISIFSEPTGEPGEPVDKYSASSARNTCKNIMREINDLPTIGIKGE